ncbi:hypothetical protein L4D00_16865 [Photobacterium swingsii]|uniref:hypothetical protein n=1 Tax=Photobacterium swingsii TaxID=680026 RepID=UPI003D0F915A
MKKALIFLTALMTSSAFANQMCDVGEVLTEDGCKRVIQQQSQQQVAPASKNDPRLNDRRCYDDGHFDPYDDDCLSAYPEFAPKGGYNPDFDDDRFEVWDD